MPPDDKQPTEKKTVEFEAAPPWAINFSERMDKGFVGVNKRLEDLEGKVDNIEGQQGLQGGQVLDIGLRLTSIEGRVGKMETSSLRPKLENESKVNLQQEAVLGTLITKVDGLEKSQAKQTEMITTVHTQVVGFVNNKKVQFVGKTLFGLAMAYAAAKGIKVLP